jgi:hypothetical protein
MEQLLPSAGSCFKTSPLVRGSDLLDQPTVYFSVLNDSRGIGIPLTFDLLPTVGGGNSGGLGGLASLVRPGSILLEVLGLTRWFVPAQRPASSLVDSFVPRCAV